MGTHRHRTAEFNLNAFVAAGYLPEAIGRHSLETDSLASGKVAEKRRPGRPRGQKGVKSGVQLVSDAAWRDTPPERARAGPIRGGVRENTALAKYQAGHLQPALGPGQARLLGPHHRDQRLRVRA